MSAMMKQMRTKGGMKSMLGMAQQAGLKPADLAKMGGMGGGGMPGGLPGLGGPSAGGLPGLGGGSLPGLPGSKKK
jgi:signal recognition particle subunit SRP54